MKGLQYLLALLACCITPPVWGHGKLGQKNIALTFDDVPRFTGPLLDRKERQSRLIAALKKAGVNQAAFFVNPARIHDPAQPIDEAFVLNYATAGHVLANHTDNHLKMGDVSANEYLSHIDAAEAWLKGKPNYRPWFRFTYLDEGGKDKEKRDLVRKGLQMRHLRNGYVTTESSDWKMHSLWTEALAAGRKIETKDLCAFYAKHHGDAADFSDDLSQKTLGRSIAQVMLLHETDLAALCIDDLVALLKSRGWTIVTADQAYSDPIASSLPETPYAQGSLLEALAWEKGVPAPRWYGYNNEKLLTEDFRIRILKEAPAE